MFFGLFKSKKDKKIEELQAEIDRLYTVPVFEVEKRNFQMYRVSRIFPKELHLKEKQVAHYLAKDFANIIEDNMIIYRDYTSDDYINDTETWIATLNIVRY